MVTANDRRMEMLRLLISRKHETVGQLAFEFGVSRMTIYRDVQILSCSYPITTQMGLNGGVFIDEDYRFGMKYLTAEQQSLLEKLAESLIGEDLVIMMTIIEIFSNPVKAS